MVIVYMMNLPTRIKAVSTENDDSSYTILINSKLNIEQQKQGYLHEMNHIKNNDFEKFNVDVIEYHAHDNEVI